MMLWESNHRQLINQWSLFFITGAIGLYLLYKNLSPILSKKQTPATLQKSSDPFFRRSLLFVCFGNYRLQLPSCVLVMGEE